ncbi:MAG: RHS repeat-associated core domain-containing protein, partial [Dehalococcoidia bacterium]
YDLNFDLNGDGAINILDLAITSAQYNRSCVSTGANTGEGRYVYNGDGLRVRSTTFPAGTLATDDYVWDQGAALPEVLQDTSSGTGTTTYVYGLSLIAKTDGGGTTSYYLPDGLGSTAQLTDTSGNVTDGYTYDAFGALRSQTGTTANDFRYTGQQNDANAARGLYYLRARAYDPALGRLLTKDPLPFIQRYMYVDDDPQNLIDPSGLFGWKDVLHTGRVVIHAGATAGSTAVNAIDNCARSHTCTSTVATIGLVAGAVTGQPWLVGVSIGVLTATDTHSCVNGDYVSCGLAAADVITVGATGLRAYGYTGAVVAGELTPAEAMLQMTSASAFNGIYRFVLSSRAGAFIAAAGLVFDNKERP